MRTKLLIAVILGFAAAAVSQGHATKAIPPAPPVALAIPRFETGLVEGRTYKNASLGLELTVPPDFEFGIPELRDTPGGVPLLVTVGARGIEPGSPVWNGVTFYADALAYYPPDQRLTSAYLRKVIRANRQQGFEHLGEPRSTKWGGVTFSRVDFQKQPAYEAVLVKACDTQKLVFIFSSSDMNTANRLIASTKLKLNAVRSHCLSQANGSSR